MATNDPGANSSISSSSGFMASFVKFVQGKASGGNAPGAVVSDASVDQHGGDIKPIQVNFSEKASLSVDKELSGYLMESQSSESLKIEINENYGDSKIGVKSDENPTKKHCEQNDIKVSPEEGFKSSSADFSNSSSHEFSSPLVPSGTPKRGGKRGRKRKGEAPHPPVPARVLPRRESSSRRAKEKVTALKYVPDSEVNDPDDPKDPSLDVDDFEDSDSDPAWTPSERAQAKGKGYSESDEEGTPRRRGRPPKNRAGHHKKVKRPLGSHRGSDASVMPNSIETPTVPAPITPVYHEVDAPGSMFRNGNFVVLKADLEKLEDLYPIWRIDGKNLLQKFAPVKRPDGSIFHKKDSSYSCWTNSTRHQYEPVDVRILTNFKNEATVEIILPHFLKDREVAMKETDKYLENFEVYIQSLISQALDGTFFSEIYKDRDEYFVSNIEMIDDVCMERQKGLLSLGKWSPAFCKAINAWPRINVVNQAPEQGSTCEACGRSSVTSLVQMYGQMYDPKSLHNICPDPEMENLKSFKICEMCTRLVTLYGRIVHLKYDLYSRCATRVTGHRQAKPNHETTEILNQLLGDDAWISLLFKEAQKLWAQADCHLRWRDKSNSKPVSE